MQLLILPRAALVGCLILGTAQAETLPGARSKTAGGLCAALAAALAAPSLKKNPS